MKGVAASSTAFAAVKNDGTVIAWGYQEGGGEIRNAVHKRVQQAITAGKPIEKIVVGKPTSDSEEITGYFQAYDLDGGLVVQWGYQLRPGQRIDRDPVQVPLGGLSL